jgi:hypothetical protein
MVAGRAAGLDLFGTRRGGGQKAGELGDMADVWARGTFVLYSGRDSGLRTGTGAFALVRR